MSPLDDSADDMGGGVAGAYEMDASLMMNLLAGVRALVCVCVCCVCVSVCLCVCVSVCLCVCDAFPYSAAEREALIDPVKSRCDT